MTSWSSSVFATPAPLYAEPRHAGPLGPFRKHLAGDYSLLRSYFLHFHIGNKMFDAALTGAIASATDNLPARYALALTILLLLAQCTCWLFLATGAWASAGKHAGRGGKRFWAYAARGAIIFSGLVMASTILVSADSIRSQWNVLAGEQPGPAPTFYLSADARSLTLEGGINDGTAAALEEALARASKVTTLVLASDGGWTREGRMIGDIIAARGLNTHVEKACSSACTLAFLAGKTRSASEDAVLGFHSFGFTDRKAGRDAAREAYVRLKMGSEFIDKVSATPPEEVWYPDPEELLRYRVLTQAQGKAPLPAGSVTAL